ncbi:hypothetical protein [Methylomicrobium lacus]
MGVIFGALEQPAKRAMIAAVASREKTVGLLLLIRDFNALAWIVDNMAKS